MFDPEELEAVEYDPNIEHPTPEQTLIREAIKYLTPKQKRIWELYNFDRLTQDEIAEKLSIHQSTVAEHIRAIEKKITKFCKSNPMLYDILKGKFNEIK